MGSGAVTRSDAGAPVGGAGQARLPWLLVGGASALSLFLLAHPYSGIVHDAELYVGRAMADADPNGLGRDIFFAHEGQSAFSIYPRLSGAFLRAVGAEPGALILTLAGLCAWFAALAVFAGQLAKGRLLWACLVTAAVVPSYYGQLFRYAEQFATPRLPAEALVLLGLGASTAGRRWFALAAMALAAALHPIMAVPGLAVWVLVQAHRDRRWLLLAAGGAALVVLVGAAGLPVAERLFQLMDRDWADALSVNSYLFPTQWSESAWGDIVVRSATILVALRFVRLPPQARAVLTSIVIVGALGVALTLLAADLWIVVLIVQAQPWRALWLLCLAGALTFPIAALGLWRQGNAGQVALACLVLGWLASPLSWIGALGAAAALLTLAADRKRPGLFTERARWIGLVAVTILGGLVLLQRLLVVFPVWSAKPPGASILGHIWLFWIWTIPVVLAAVLLAARRNATPRPIAAAGALLLSVLAALLWDDRPPFARVATRYQPDSELVRFLPPGHGEILWLKGGATYAWKLAGRPNWASYAQGGSIVFSRDLGMIWRDRMDRLVASGLASEADRYPWAGKPDAILEPTRADIEGFCRAPDAPVVIVVPDDGTVRLPEGLEMRTYRLPAPSQELRMRPEGLRWQSLGQAFVVPCSTGHQSGALRGSGAG